MRRALLAGLALLAFGTALAEPTHRTLTFEARVAAQRAIEEVYWRHRIWPKENAQAKPPLSTVMPDSMIRARVEDYLKKSNALETWWHRPIQGEQLQAELHRMATQTRDGAMLGQIFRALGDDPFTIAETFARQTLVDRLIRNWYADDTRFHGAQRAKVEAALGVCASVGCMRSMSGEYRETRWVLRTENRPHPTETDAVEISLAPDEWNDRIAHLGRQLGASKDTLPTGVLSDIEETADAFLVTTLLEQNNTRFVTASVTWPKRAFDAWWDVARRVEGIDVKQGEPSVLTLPRVSPSVCTDNTWSTMLTLDPRNDHRAVWTGAEMIVWGGGFNTGFRYDPASDSWTRTSVGVNVPSARFSHTAVWTGTEMIIWGGSYQVDYFNTGGRYNPSTDTWVPISTGSNVPTARSYHSAVWTGTQMIVWGGISDFGYLNTGARYTPSTDTWTATSVAANVPAARYFQTAVWTGTRMIIWGGSAGFEMNSGGQYDPVANSWTPTSTGPNVPTFRRYHTAVWTGSEMIVWGGGNSNTAVNTGGRYDPSTDSWVATSVGTNVPPASSFHTVVWTGTEMIVWGGSTYNNVGRRYDPPSDSWTLATALNAPVGRRGQTAIWTGNEMIVWGGQNVQGRSLSTGGRYRPSTDSWISTSTMNVPTARYAHSAVWTGAELIVWGGFGGVLLNTGGRWDPTSDTWTPTSNGANVPSARYLQSVVWTGTEMIVWGGSTDAEYFNTGGRYNPASDSWAPTSTAANVPTARFAPAVWTGTEMIVWGGFNSSGYLATGGRYDPSTDTWVATSNGANLPATRSGHSAVWTGTEMIIWGGYYASPGDHYENSGGRYNPSTNSWSATSLSANVPGGRSGHTAVWSGTEMIVWGGGSLGGTNINTGGRYNPATDSWLATSTGANVPAARSTHAALWTGTEMLVWGGRTFSSNRVNTGGRYNPSSNSWTSTSVGSNVPAARESLGYAWTGAEMIVWGGLAQSSIDPYLDSGGSYCVCPSRRTSYRDSDGDGYGDPGNPVEACFDSIPAGYVANHSDCDDANPSLYQGSQEINDGLDNQCPGDVGFGMIDELDDSGSVAADRVTFSWPIQSNATLYQLARATTPDFTTACTLSGGPSPNFVDAETPALGTAFYYIARAAAPFVGSWGQSSAGLERTTSCP